MKKGYQIKFTWVNTLIHSMFFFVIINTFEICKESDDNLKYDKLSFINIVLWDLD